MKNADLPAMPIEINGFGQYAPEAFTGLTKREMFAMSALNGMLSNRGRYESWNEDFVKRAIYYADMLLKELEKTNEKQ